MLDKFVDFILGILKNANPTIIIDQYRRGVLLRVGKFVKVLDPGLHFRIPFIDSYMEDVVVNDTICIREVNTTTNDNISISIAGECNLEIVDIYKSMILTKDWRSNLVDVSRGIFSTELSNYTWEQIYTGEANEKIGALIQQRAKLIGIRTWNFNFTDKLGIIGLKVFNS